MAIAYFIGGSQDLTKRCVERAQDVILFPVITSLASMEDFSRLPNDAPVPTKEERYRLESCVGRGHGEDVLVYVAEPTP